MPDRIDTTSLGDSIIQLLTHPLSMITSAAGGLLSPWWIPSLSEAHDMASEWLPILGCVVALMQIVAFGVKTGKNGR